MTKEADGARRVIVDALTARHEELRGVASPLDFDGASQIIRALGAAGYVITKAEAPRDLPADERISIALAVLLEMSEQSTDRRLRDDIADVRTELHEALENLHCCTPGGERNCARHGETDHEAGPR